jgi:glutathione S-transferase
MSRKLTLHEVSGSPNNIKVRIALGYKGLTYDRIPVDFSEGFPGNRDAVIAASTQARTPVLVDGDRSLFDSGAILRYLDCNFPDTPRLYSDDYARMGEIEEWEMYGKTELGAPLGMMFGQAMSPEPDLAVCKQASGLLNEATGRIETALENSPFVLGDAMSAADVVTAPAVLLSLLPEGEGGSPIHAFFQAHLHLGDGRDRTREWMKRVMSHDEDYRKAI